MQFIKLLFTVESLRCHIDLTYAPTHVENLHPPTKVNVSAVAQKKTWYNYCHCCQREFYLSFFSFCLLCQLSTACWRFCYSGLLVLPGKSQKRDWCYLVDYAGRVYMTYATSSLFCLSSNVHLKSKGKNPQINQNKNRMCDRWDREPTETWCYYNNKIQYTLLQSKKNSKNKTKNHQTSQAELVY